MNKVLLKKEFKVTKWIYSCQLVDIDTLSPLPPLSVTLLHKIWSLETIQFLQHYLVFWLLSRKVLIYS